SIRLIGMLRADPYLSSREVESALDQAQQEMFPETRTFIEFALTFAATLCNFFNILSPLNVTY
ncbi:1235_t:CDS:2, partial [Racocetra persica]